MTLADGGSETREIVAVAAKLACIYGVGEVNQVAVCRREVKVRWGFSCQDETFIGVYSVIANITERKKQHGVEMSQGETNAKALS